MDEFRPLSVGLALAVLVLLSSTVPAQERQPPKVVTLIVAGSAGDSLDQTGRAFAGALSASLGQSVVVQNVPGAMTDGLARLRNAAPDGLTLGVIGSFAAILKPRSAGPCLLDRRISRIWPISGGIRSCWPCRRVRRTARYAIIWPPARASGPP